MKRTYKKQKLAVLLSICLIGNLCFPAMAAAQQENADLSEHHSEQTTEISYEEADGHGGGQELTAERSTDELAAVEGENKTASSSDADHGHTPGTGSGGNAAVKPDTGTTSKPETDSGAGEPDTGEGDTGTAPKPATGSDAAAKPVPPNNNLVVPEVPNSLTRTITSWEWIDPEGYLTGNNLVLPNGNADNQMNLAKVVSMLPMQISGTVDQANDDDSEEGALVKSTGETQVISLGDWTCSTFKPDDSGSWPITGSYTFSTSLPTGFTLADDVPRLEIEVTLGGANILMAKNTGDFTVTGNSSDYSYDPSTRTLTVKGSSPLSISGTSTMDKILVEKDISANITLDGVNIDVSGTDDACAFQIADDSKGTVNLTLQGDNTLKSGSNCAGLQKSGESDGIGNLTINGSGRLEAAGGMSGAGIGGGKGKAGSNITISDGDVTATGGRSGAGIGGGGGAQNGNKGGDGNTITISGGHVTVTGGESLNSFDGGAGIGGGGGGLGSTDRDHAGIGGNGGDGSNITISGGNVEVLETSGGAGIGGGAGGSGVKNIDGIGGAGGNGGNGSGITIESGTVTVHSSNGAGIGGGAGGIGALMDGGGGGNGGNGSNITIQGGDVTTQSSLYGAGIGGGTGGKGGYSKSSGKSGGNGGKGGNGSNIKIQSGNVLAQSGNGGAGIGGGFGGVGGGASGSTGGNGNNGGDGSNITISGGNVAAQGGDGGAGIGGGGNGWGGRSSSGNGSSGNGGSGSSLTIEGEHTVVIARKGTNATDDIGSGQSANSSSTNAVRNGGLIIEGTAGKLYSNVTVQGEVTIPSGVTVTIESGKTLTVGDGGILTNQGTITVNSGGTLKMDSGGVINEAGTLDGSGSKPNENDYNHKNTMLTLTADDTAAHGTVAYGKAITLTANVTSPDTENATLSFLIVPQKKVVFYCDSAKIGESAVNDATNSASIRITLTGSAYEPGYHTFTAKYGGGNDHHLPADSGIFQLLVTQAEQARPDAPTSSAASDTSITLNTVSGQKYICTSESAVPSTGGSDWQTADNSTMVFSNLTPNTGYYFWTYKPGDVCYQESAVSPSLSVTTDKSGDQKAVEKAKQIIEQTADWTVQQADANTEAAVKTELAQQINNLTGMGETGVTVAADDITVSSFTAAQKGTADNSQGTDGSFTFTAALKKHSFQTQTGSITGKITATAFTGQTNVQAVAKAKQIIEQTADWTVKQSAANTKEAVKTELAQQINNLAGMSDTGITVEADNITVSNFTSAAPGTPDNRHGTDGSFHFAVSLSKGSANATTDSKTGKITATPYTIPFITTASLPDGKLGQEYSQTLAADSEESLTWSVTAGRLPEGLTLNASTGIISGSPAKAGSFHFTVTATNNAGLNDKELSINIPKADQTNFAFLGGSTVEKKNGSGSFTVKAEGGQSTGGVTYAVTSGTDVISVDENTGEVTVLKAGGAVITADKAGDGNYNPATANLHVTITPADALTGTLTITGTPKDGETLTAALTDSNNTGSLSYRWLYNGAELAAGSVYTLKTSDVNHQLTVEATSSVQTGSLSGTTATIQPRSTGGSSDDDSQAAIPPSNQPKPNSPATGEITVGEADKDGVAQIPTAQVADAINKATADAQKNGTGKNGVAVAVNLPTGAVTATLDRAALDQLVASGVKNLRLGFSGAALTFDLAALKEIGAQTAGTVAFSAKKASGLTGDAPSAIGTRPAYDFTVAGQKDGKQAPVTTFGGGSVSMELDYTPAPSEQIGNLYAVYVNGNSVEWITKSSYDRNIGAVIFTTNHFSVFGVGCKTPAAFTDTANHWARDDIQFAVSRGLLSGTGETTFSPDTAVTRGMFVTALGRLAGINPDSYKTGKFTDVSAAAYYAPYVNWAAAQGILDGAGETTFSPDTALTREQMAQVVERYAQKLGCTLPLTREAETFADKSQISGSMQNAVNTMQQAGIMNDMGEHRFAPKDPATRAQAAAVLRRLVEVTIDPAAANGWAQNDAGSWLYYENRKPATGWKLLDGGWYYFNPAGLMQSGGWKEIGGKWYYFYQNGAMAANAKIDGYEVGPDGARKDN